jgi:hypothetical protein
VSQALELIAAICIAVGAIWVSGIALIAAIAAVRGGRRRRRSFIALSQAWSAGPTVRGSYSRLTKPASGPF